jgi:hypothetical protein
MNGKRPGATVDTSAPDQLVRAAAALRWKRPDLTATLAELARCAALPGPKAAAGIKELGIDPEKLDPALL